MAHVVLIINDLTGRLYSSFEMSRRLQSEGHTITYMSLGDFEEKIKPLGFNYVQLAPINSGLKDSHLQKIQSSSWTKRLGYHLKNYTKHYLIWKEVLGLSKYEKQLKEVKADHFIIDMELHDLIFTAYSSGAPITLFTAWFSNRMGYGTKLPPLRTDIIPGKGIKGSPLGILANWLFIKFKVQARIVVNKLTFKDYRRSTLKKYAKSIGFPTRTLVASNLPHLFCYTNLPIATFALKEMDFPHTPNDNLIYAGPMVYEKRNMVLDAEINSVINEVIDKKKKEGKKIIYCSVGSIILPEKDFFTKVINAVKDNDDWLLVLSFGGKPIDDAFIFPPNVYPLPWVPQLKILEYADCCMGHGGLNTIFECIHFAVPILVYSCGIAEGNGNAARIHYHRLGIMGDRFNDSSKAIKQHLEAILYDDAYKNNLNRFQKICRQYQQKNLSELLQIES